MAKKKRVSSKKKSSKKKEVKTVNVNDLVEQADAAMEALDLEMALQRYTAAASILRRNIELLVPEADPILLAKVLGKLGDVKVSLGDTDTTVEDDFETAVSLLPVEKDTVDIHELRASLLLYLGQLRSQHDALDAYQKGVEELNACIRLREKQAGREGSTDEDPLQENRRQLSAAYCAIAELYMTDLCFEENAEQECEAAVQAAMAVTEADEPLVDSLQSMASLRLSQRRSQEATKYMLHAYQKMKGGCEALAALVGLQRITENDEATEQHHAVELVDVDAANNLPGFEFRCQSAKILLECCAILKKQDESLDSKTLSEHCSDSAIQVLGSLLAENDEVIEVWYLLGCACEAASDPESAGHYWERALEMLLKVKESLELGDGDDNEENELEEVDSQIEEISKKLKEIGHQQIVTTDTDDVEMAS